MMAKEIERKFILGELPKELDIKERKTIYQSYLALGKEEVRIRRVQYESIPDKFYLTYKNRLKDKFAREEVEIEITERTYEQLNSKFKPIVKDRLLIELGYGLWAEVDIFQNTGFQLRTVEVEFKSITEAESFVPPFWFGRELTGTGEYGNQLLFKIINGIN